jgi:hypothetical protein
MARGIVAAVKPKVLRHAVRATLGMSTVRVHDKEVVALETAGALDRQVGRKADALARAIALWVAQVADRSQFEP